MGGAGGRPFPDSRAAPHPLPYAQARASMALTGAELESMPPARTVEI